MENSVKKNKKWNKILTGWEHFFFGERWRHGRSCDKDFFFFFPEKNSPFQLHRVKEQSSVKQDLKKSKTRYTWDLLLQDIDGDIDNLERNVALEDLVMRESIPVSVRGKVIILIGWEMSFDLILFTVLGVAGAY